MTDITQSYFANWKDQQLSRLSTVLTIGKVTFVIGLGLSIYMLSIPVAILSGVGLTICLIGGHAVRREQVDRCRRACLELEGWLTTFKDKCEKLLSLSSFIDTSMDDVKFKTTL